MRVFLAGVLAIAGAACHSHAAGPVSPTQVADLETRLRRVEETLAKSAEALEFLSKVYEQQKQQAADEEAREPAPGAVFGVAIEPSVQAGLIEGGPAFVTIIKAFDFACPYCERSSNILTELVKEYGGKLRVVYMDFVVHDFAEPAHLAGCAAARQGKYVPFKKAFWEKSFGSYSASRGKDRSGFEQAALLDLAKGAQLDVERFKADMAGPACTTLLAQERAELEKFHVSGTPAFFVNGIFIGGGVEKDTLRAVIEDRLRVAEASGVPAAQYYDREILQKGEKKFRSKKDPRP
jgi:protein-disulfide isomerase